MINPARLEASVRGVYGDELFDASYGRLIPIDESRVRQMNDGDTIRLGNRTLEFMDTPGHARHHFCVWDAETRGWFTGDTFGVSYPELFSPQGAYILPTTTPVEFDPESLKDSIRKLLGKNPEWMYLTHYGRVGGVQKLASQLLSGIDALVDIAERHKHREDRQDLISRDLSEWLMFSSRAHGVSLSDSKLAALLQPDVDLNTQGVEVWLKRREKSAGA